VRIPVKLDQALQALARRAKIPASSIIVDAIEDYIMEQPE
jgi:predicted transcriptional regulator